MEYGGDTKIMIQKVRITFFKLKAFESFQKVTGGIRFRLNEVPTFFFFAI